MGKRIPVITVAEPAAAARLAGLPVEATVALADVAGAIRDGLLAFASSTGLVVMQQLMEAELSARVGPKHARIPDRAGNWHGSTSGSVMLGGRRVAARRPRGRTMEGAEIALDSWAAFASEDLLDQVVMERMLAGVATRRHADVAEPIGPELEARSSDEPLGRVAPVRAGDRGGPRRADGPRPVRARGGGADDRRHRRRRSVLRGALVSPPRGARCRSGCAWATPRTRPSCTDLLADLVARGLSREGGLLVVIDGAKALATAVRKVFGDRR